MKKFVIKIPVVIEEHVDDVVTPMPDNIEFVMTAPDDVSGEQALEDCLSQLMSKLS